MQDVVDNQIELGTPDSSANYPKIGKPQIGTLSLSGNDLVFGNASIVLFPPKDISLKHEVWPIRWQLRYIYSFRLLLHLPPNWPL